MWEELGIEPTTDAKAIRRAYATRLRGLDADREPAAFQRLRSAYEHAINRAGKPVSAPLPQTPVTLLPSESAPFHTIPEPQAATPSEADLDAADTEAATKAVREALAGKHYEDAFAALDRGLARGSFSLDQRELVLSGIMRKIMADTDISPNTFCYFMKRAGWDMLSASRQRVTQIRQMANNRLEAEMWFLRMRDLADGDPVPMPSQKKFGWLRPWVGLQQWLRRRIERRNASVFFGSWHFWRWSNVSLEDLRRKTYQYHHYENLLKERFEPKNIARADRIVKWRTRWDEFAKPNRTIIYFVFVALVFAVFLALHRPASGVLVLIFGWRIVRAGLRHLKVRMGLNG